MVDILPVLSTRPARRPATTTPSNRLFDIFRSTRFAPHWRRSASGSYWARCFSEEEDLIWGQSSRQWPLLPSSVQYLHLHLCPAPRASDRRRSASGLLSVAPATPTPAAVPGLAHALVERWYGWRPGRAAPWHLGGFRVRRRLPRSETAIPRRPGCRRARSPDQPPGRAARERRALSFHPSPREARRSLANCRSFVSDGPAPYELGMVTVSAQQSSATA